MTELRASRERQLEWALARGLTPDARGHLDTVDENLFEPLNQVTRKNFEDGDGAELDHKMKAVHSSSALAVNVFDYWRGRDAGPLGAALGTRAGIVDVQFEQKFATGLRGHAPNLDVVLTLADGSIVAIESKFLEPYSRHSDHGFKPKYFEHPGGEWATHGLPACQQAAEDLQSGVVSYRWLNAEQLLKHALGLAAEAEEPWSLWCAWYDVGGPTAEQHAQEVEDFSSRVAGDPIGFRAFTYQELFGELLRTCGDEHGAYLDYLGSRYFPEQPRPGFRTDRFTWHAGDVTITPPKSEPHRG